MASTINASNASSGGIITTADASGVLQLQTANTAAVTIDASQNVGIGTTTPSFPLDINKAGGAAIRGGHGFNWYNSDNTNNYYIYNAGATGSSNANLLFVQGGVAERMRIDASGNLLVGTTSSTPTNTSVNLLAGIVAAGGYRTHNGITGSTWTNAFNLYWTGSATQLWIDSTNQGTITVSSDYRIKKNIETQELPALTRISQIRPVTYTFKDYEPFSWKADGIAREGFIAHELAEVIPSAVEGEKDAKNQVQSLKLDALCSVMVKAIQELKAIIDTQEERIAVLEAK